MRKIRTLLPPALTLAALCAVHLLLAAAFAALPQRIEARPSRYDLLPGEAVAAEELERYRGRGLAYGKETAGSVEGEECDLVLTNSAYGAFGEFTLTAGGYFTERAPALGLNVAVISEDLAFSLFGHNDVVGNPLSIGGVAYRICGVYTRPRLWRDLTSDGRETVFLPVGSGFDRLYGEDVPVRHILLPAREDASGAFTAEEVRDDLRSLSPRIEGYQIRDFSHGARSVRQPLSLALLLLALLLAVRLARRGIGILREIRDLVQESLPTRSVREVVRQNRAFLLRRALRLLLLAGIAVGALLLARFELYLPSRFLPTESILDLGFYRRLILDALVERNRLYAYRPSPYEICFRFAQTASLLLAALEIWAGAWLYRRSAYL